jgi:S1-C subfamily serine protease
MPTWKRSALFNVLVVVSPLFGHTAPLSQQEACAKFSDAVVSIESGGQIRGTGFIVSEDGLIITANHVIRNEEGAYYQAIIVTLKGGSIAFAKPVDPISPEAIGKDFALIKVDIKDKLPFLKMGSSSEVEIGSEATIIGFPFSAIQRRVKFCVVAEFAAVEPLVQSVTWRNTRSAAPVAVPIKVKVVYFQGPSIQGISGSPVISRTTGNVVGIR